MPKIFTSEKQKIGEIGENIAVRFLMKHDFSVLERNYTKKWGEIDIISEKNGKLYFIEVKSISRPDLKNVSSTEALRSLKTSNGHSETQDRTRPEENMHPWKLKRLSRTIQTYLLSKKAEERKWQVDLLIVSLDLDNKNARVKVISDIIL